MKQIFQTSGECGRWPDGTPMKEPLKATVSMRAEFEFTPTKKPLPPLDMFIFGFPAKEQS